ncbi:MAG: pyruvate carboxylase subunit B [Verrucomicrobiota bacterium]
MSTQPVIFNNTVLRDGHQSLAATRMKTEQMIPALADLDSLGFGNLETWGGATIDSCVRFLNENPFERITALKKGAPKTRHSMLLRGQNIVQYMSFPDDVVETFVKCTADRGMDEFRIFDALNDTRNMQTAIRTVLKLNKTARGEICYTISPVHTIEAFVQMSTELVEMGCQMICIKDMAGLIQPQIAYKLIKELKTKLSVPIILHSHDTAGLAGASYCAAVEAGVDVIETSIVPFANGSGQPDTVRMMALLEGSPRCPNYNRETLQRLHEHFNKVYQELSKFTSPVNERVDSDILRYQIPGGMLSNFVNQLKEQGMADRLAEVMQEVAYVRQCLGYIPLVTPTSQIVGTQAMMNVKFGRWKMIPQPTADVALGKYGRTPGPIDQELLKIVCEKTKQEPITGRPADLLEPRMDKLKAELKEKDLPVTDEIAVLYAMFPQEVMKLLKPQPSATPPPAPSPTPSTAPANAGNSGVSRLALTVNQRQYSVTVEEI